MRTVLITGGTGLIGKALTKVLLERGYEIIILTRNPNKKKPDHTRLSYAGWNIEQQAIDREAVSKADYIIHLAGAAVAEKRWSRKRKQEIVDSRVQSSRLLVKVLSKYENKVKAVISSSAIGWYGPDHPSPPGEEQGVRFIETDPPSNDFLGTTCKLWEESIAPVNGLGKRLVVLRTGIVLSNEGGALKELRKPLRFGIAAVLGSGKQIVSWIHIDDLVNMFLYAIENEKIKGIYNAVAPCPVSNKELVLELAKTGNRFYIPFYVPSFLLKMVMEEMSFEVLKSATVSSAKIEQAGFIFQYPRLHPAIRKSEDS